MDFEAFQDSKKRLIFFIFLLVSFNCFAQKSEQKRHVTKIEYPNPPGGIHLYDNVYIDESEIANIHYMEYLFFIKKDSSNAFYLSQLPDSSTWEIGFQQKDSIDPYISNYFRYPGFRYFPVVGISYEQALNYCKWRSDIVTKNITTRSNYKIKRKLRKFDVTIEYRLPTKEEWEYAASGGLNLVEHPFGIIRPTNRKWYRKKTDDGYFKKCFEKKGIQNSTVNSVQLLEFNLLDQYYFDTKGAAFSCTSDSTFGLNFIYDFPPNNFFLYNMIGNVAEMTNIKGVAKGCYFRTKLEDCSIQKDFLYDRPKEWLGFRCMGIVHMRKK